VMVFFLSDYINCSIEQTAAKFGKRGSPYSEPLCCPDHFFKSSNETFSLWIEVTCCEERKAPFRKNALASCLFYLKNSTQTKPNNYHIKTAITRLSTYNNSICNN
jgi:hypothetical protein